MTPTDPTQISQAAFDRIYHEWDEALANNDVAGLLALYAPDAMLESPLVPYLMNSASGVLRGHEELRRLFEEVVRRKPEARRYYRTAYLTNGARLVWEYPRAAPEGEQMDFVEVMELREDGLIQNHRIYWGWFGVGVLLRDAYRR